MSLIEEALRRQQEQERQRAQAAGGAAPRPAAAGEPPPLPTESVAAGRAHSALPAGVPRSGAKTTNIVLLILVVATLCGMAGLATWWFTRSRVPSPANTVTAIDRLTKRLPWAKAVAAVKRSVLKPSKSVPPNGAPPRTNGGAAGAASLDAPGTTAPPAVAFTSQPAATHPAAPPPAPSPVAPKAARPTLQVEEPWPKFTLKGRVAFGRGFALILGTGQILEVGDQTASGIRLESAAGDRVRLSYRSQIREYRLQAGTFVLMPPADDVR